MGQTRGAPTKKNTTADMFAETFSELGRGFGNAGRELWGFREELLMVAVTAVAYARFGVPALIGMGVLWAVALAVPHVRHSLGNTLERGAVRRAWTKACKEAEAPEVPRILDVQNVAAGSLVHVRLTAKMTAAGIAKHAEQLAASMKIRDVRVLAGKTKDTGTVLLVRRDPFDEQEPIDWPLIDHDGEVSIWDPVPLGVDEEGEQVAVDLIEHNMLIGGEPGAGKSVALSLIAATAARAIDCVFWVADGKLVELASWRPFTYRHVGPDVKATIAMLRELHDVMEQRYQELLSLGRRKIHREDGLPIHLVMIDELAFYLHAPPKKLQDEVAELLRDLVARGRAAGIILVCATQKPDAKTVPSNLRDLIAFRWALRCNTPQMSDTILGQGWAAQGYNAVAVSTKQRGVGYLKAEEDEPRKVRSYYLSDEHIDAMVERMISRAVTDELQPSGPMEPTLTGRVEDAAPEPPEAAPADEQTEGPEDGDERSALDDLDNMFGE